MLAIRNFIDKNKPQAVMIIGAVVIGLAVCVNMDALGKKITLIEKLPQEIPGLDNDMTAYVHEQLEKHVVNVLT